MKAPNAVREGESTLDQIPPSGRAAHVIAGSLRLGIVLSLTAALYQSSQSSSKPEVAPVPAREKITASFGKEKPQSVLEKKVENKDVKLVWDPEVKNINVGDPIYVEVTEEDGSKTIAKFCMKGEGQDQKVIIGNVSHVQKSKFDEVIVTESIEKFVPKDDEPYLKIKGSAGIIKGHSIWCQRHFQLAYEKSKSQKKGDHFSFTVHLFILPSTATLERENEHIASLPTESSVENVPVVEKQP